MLCEHCLNDFVVPRLREDDIAVLEFLYNENIILPQTAMFRDDIAKGTKLSSFKNWTTLCRLECYNLIELRPWKKSYHYYLNDLGIKALTILSKKLEGGTQAC